VAAERPLHVMDAEFEASSGTDGADRREFNASRHARRATRFIIFE
jgi:hypothetical protein